MSNYLENYQRWLNSDALTNAEKQELEAIKDNDDEIKLRFSSVATNTSPDATTPLA